MLVEAAKPVTFILCILSLYAVFHAAFMAPSSDLHEKIYESMLLLALSAIVSVISGISFRAAEPEPQAHNMRLISTLPLQLFCWATSIMLVLFLLSWYLESFCVFYKDVRRF
jgi:cation transport ATPase